MKTAQHAKVLSGIGVIALLGLTACGDGGTADDATTPGDAMTTETDDMATQDDMATEDDMATDSETEASGDMAADAELVGAGCADYAEQNPDGPGSVDGMAEDPVATAASNNPMLTTLTSAVSGELNPDVDLVDTLNGGEFTVFAPVDEAFEAIPEEDLNALAEDADGLTDVLTYHVVEGQMSPDEISGEQLDTLQGETVTVEGEGDDLMVEGATVVCGGVQTANATVYLIDEVLMPEMAEQ